MPEINSRGNEVISKLDKRFISDELNGIRFALERGDKLDLVWLKDYLDWLKAALRGGRQTGK